MKKTYRKYDHDLGASIASKEILFNIKNNKDWTSSFLKNDVCKAYCKKSKPSPDARFYSGGTKCHVAVEYKPPYADLDEIGKGFNQCFDYITDELNGNLLNQASYLVVPRINESGDKIKEIYKNKFELTVYGKNPIALITYDPENPSDIELVVDFSHDCQPPDKIVDMYGKNLITYWAAWRENYPSFNYRLLKTAYEHSKNNIHSSPETIWDDFYKNHYCYPENANQTLEHINTNLKVWDDTPFIWMKDIKTELQKAVRKNLISYDEAHYRLKWASASSKDEMVLYGNKIKNIKIRRPKHFNADNDYQDIKKNRRNFLSHTDLWDNNSWKPTTMGKTFLNQIEKGSDPMLELGTITLFLGRWFDLIHDIKQAQKNINAKNNSEFKEKLKIYFLKNGLIGVNPGRKTTGSRSFLQAEQQLLGRLGILIRNGNTYFNKDHGWQFNEERIESFLHHYYSIYDAEQIAA